jgi:hypothetical protein
MMSATASSATMHGIAEQHTQHLRLSCHKYARSSTCVLVLLLGSCVQTDSTGIALLCSFELAGWFIKMSFQH